MKKSTPTNDSKKKSCLNEEEARELALELRKSLEEGVTKAKYSSKINLIVAGLGDKRGRLRRTFSESLAAIGTDSLPELRKALLNSSNVIVRRAAAKTLKLVGDISALPDLVESLTTDADPVVQGSAAGAIAIFGEKAARHLLKVIESPKSSSMQCGLAFWALGFIGAEANLALREAAKSSTPKIKAAAIAALGEQIQFLEDNYAKELLVESLDDQVDEVRGEATSLLWRLHEASWTKPYLLKSIHDPNIEIRKRSILSLIKSNEYTLREVLEERLLIEEDIDVIKVLNIAINYFDSE